MYVCYGANHQPACDGFYNQCWTGRNPQNPSKIELSRLEIAWIVFDDTRTAPRAERLVAPEIKNDKTQKFNIYEK